MKTMYVNARVFTGALPLQEAFMVEDGRFSFVGSQQDVLAQDADERVDLQGAFVCPGFIDSHMHLLNYGSSLQMAPLHEHTDSLSDMLDCLKNTAPSRGGWILGRGWNQDYFADERRMPTRHDLDMVSREHPVCATRACGHALVVNTKALELLHITGNTPQVEGGLIVMENGQPNGLFFDNAMDLVSFRIPAPTLKDVKDMIEKGCRALNAYGVTSCHSDDYGVFHTLGWEVVNQAFRELEAEGKLTVRVYEQANLTTVEALEDFIAKGNCTGKGSDMFRIGPLKLLGDGALGARTAFLSVPYADAPETRGLSVFTQEEFDALIGCAHRNGMQTAVHCIGDRCLDRVLDAMEKTMTAHPRDDHRHGIVHCQITRRDQWQRMADMKLHAYAQSIFLDYDIHMVRERVGDQLADTSYSWKTLKGMGVTVSNGTDCPVERPFALGGMQCAVTRCDLKGHGPYLAHEAFTVEEALQSYTRAGACASFEEHKKGQIAPGMLADFTVLSHNLFDIDPEDISKTKVMQVYLGGRRMV